MLYLFGTLIKQFTFFGESFLPNNILKRLYFTSLILFDISVFHRFTNGFRPPTPTLPSPLPLSKRSPTTQRKRLRLL